MEARQSARFQTLLTARRGGQPIAYLTGEREFWSLTLQVNEHTLIPRPETETLIEWALELALPPAARVADWGTGSGAIALALASERPAWQLLATDISEDALVVARDNARRLALANVKTLCTDWELGLEGQKFDLLVSNPPYVVQSDPHLEQGDLRFEPRSALASGPQGLDALRRIISVAPDYLEAGGWLLLEHGYDQGSEVLELLESAGFSATQCRQDLAGMDRISGGVWDA